MHSLSLTVLSIVAVGTARRRRTPKTVTRIVLTYKPVSEDLLDDEGQIIDLKTQGFHGLRMQISQDGRSYFGTAISPTLEGTVSLSGTVNPKWLTVFTLATDMAGHTLPSRRWMKRLHRRWHPVSGSRPSVQGTPMSSLGIRPRGL